MRRRAGVFRLTLSADSLLTEDLFVGIGFFCIVWLVNGVLAILGIWALQEAGLTPMVEGMAEDLLAQPSR